jgi:hypothetical protein
MTVPYKIDNLHSKAGLLTLDYIARIYMHLFRGQLFGQYVLIIAATCDAGPSMGPLLLFPLTSCCDYKYLYKKSV